MTSKKTVCVFVLMLIQIGIIIFGSAAQMIVCIAFEESFYFSMNLQNILSFFPSCIFTLVILIIMMRIDGIEKTVPEHEKTGKLAKFARSMLGRKWRLAFSIIFFVFAAYYSLYLIASMLGNNYFKYYDSFGFIYNTISRIISYLTTSIDYVAVAIFMLPSKTKTVNITIDAPKEKKAPEEQTSLDWHA